MGELNISINKRPFQISCADGDEHNVARLAEDLAARVSEIKKNVGEAGDTRLLVLAGLTMCDELHMMKEQLDILKEQIAMNAQTSKEIDSRQDDLEKTVIDSLTNATHQLQSMSVALVQSS